MKLTAGFDVGGTQIKFGLVKESGHIIFKGITPSPPDLAGLAASLQAVWARMHQQTGRQKIRAAGFGFPGIFKPEKEMVLQSPNYPALDGLPLRPFLKSWLDVPFWIDNDANLAAYGEWWLGAKRKPKSLVLLTLGTGVGSGIILDGKIWHGTAGFAAEIGHVTVNPEGERCRCGNRGCLETEVSGPAIVRNYLSLTGKKNNLTSKDIASFARKKDEAAKKSFDRAGYYLGIALGIIISTLNPEMIVLGGGVIASGSLLLSPALKEARKRCFTPAFASTLICRASLGNDAGFIGAALLAQANWKET